MNRFTIIVKALKTIYGFKTESPIYLHTYANNIAIDFNITTMKITETTLLDSETTKRERRLLFCCNMCYQTHNLPPCVISELTDTNKAHAHSILERLLMRSR